MWHPDQRHVVALAQSSAVVQLLDQTGHGGRIVEFSLALRALSPNRRHDWNGAFPNDRSWPPTRSRLKRVTKVKHRTHFISSANAICEKPILGARSTYKHCR